MRTAIANPALWGPMPPLRHHNLRRPTVRLVPALAAIALATVGLVGTEAASQENGGAPNRADVYASLEAARQAYVQGEYGAIVERLGPIAESPERLQAVEADTRAEIFRLLGLGYLLRPSPDLDRARSAFLELLKLQPRFEFIEGVTPQEAITLLAEVKAAHPELVPDTGDGGPQPGAGVVYIEREVVYNPYWLNFLPPLGQFQNGEEVKGYFFLFAEGVALATNVTTYFIVEQLRGSDGLYTRSNAEAASAAQDIQIVSFYVLLGFVALGIWDAWNDWEPATIRIKTLDKPPPELADSTIRRRRTERAEAGGPMVGLEPVVSPSAAEPAGAGWSPDGVSGMLLRVIMPF